MSSGEILFILAFIVLPTAVLVSSAWAILFVRRRPDRVAEHQADDPRWEEMSTADDDAVLRETADLNTVAVNEEPATAVRETDEGYLRGDEADTNEDDRSDQADVAKPVAELEPGTGSVRDEEEPETLAVVQTTDDLDAVVAEVRANETKEKLPEPEPDPTPEPEPEADTMVYDTTELPVLERPEARPVEPGPMPKPVPIVEPIEEPEVLEAEEEAGSRWRRRKRPAQLRPADPDTARPRARNRDPQRQVPQIGRSPRRRDGSQRDSSQSPEESGDTT